MRAVLVTDLYDGDRPLVADEMGSILRGDLIGLLTARALGADAVATPLSSNTALERSGWIPRVVRTRIGSPYVIEAMAELHASGAQLATGYEANGGFLLGSEASGPAGRIGPLPTRDALLPMLTVLTAAALGPGSLSTLAAEAPARFTASDRLEAIDSSRSAPFLMSLACDSHVREALLEPLNGPQVTGIDTLDGVRLSLVGDEIVHLRASGNAPELRCYAEAADARRASSLVALALERVARLLPP